MAQNSIAFKFKNNLLTTINVCYRLLHDGGAGSAATLHNADSVIGLVADSMGRSKSKLNGEDQSKIGPNTNLLKQLPKIGEAVSEVKNEENTNVLPDPNTSMWNMCKDTNETAGKKLKMKFRKLKDNIKNYYLARLEENQILFTEVEETFKIGKLDKKDYYRSSKYRENLEDMESMLEEVQPPMMRPAMRERINLMNQPQTKVEENLEANQIEENFTEDIIQEQLTQQQSIGYRQFNKSDYTSRPSNEYAEKEMETKTEKVMAKNANLEASRNERYSEPEQNRMRKRPQVKSEKVNERGTGGLSDIRGMASAMYFKADGLGDKYKHLLRMVASDNAFQRSFSTFTRHFISGGCRPPPLPAQVNVCEPGEKLPKCLKPEGYDWPPCPKITLCGCEPPHPRACKLNCGDNEKRALLALAKRPDYICPSFSECKRNTELVEKRRSECCWSKKTCDMLIGPRKPFVTALERQEMSLGQRYWTAKKTQKCSYHMSARKFAEDADKEGCDKEKKGLPCHKPGGKTSQASTAKGSCEKICMPCCEPARVPPTCDSSKLHKPMECNKIDNPRPSFSECKKSFAMKHIGCECDVVSKPKCPEKKTKDETC